ncbi:MAG: hypothetical protein QOD66_926 [Solirubrobacteraceae bacterium]|jgi:hypothetical protein|nr:hypothetical protein [Solirubrobacteraceae bacterium]
MLAVLIGVMFAGASVAAAAKVVRYQGFVLRVPSAWPVVDLAAHPRSCVRFDRHAVYLGHPGASQRCPAHAVGRTEAILVEPLAAAAAAGANAVPGTILPGGGASTRILRRSARVSVTATWGRNPGTVARALGVRAVHASRLPPAPAGPAAHAAAGPVAHAAGFTTGLGFDPCSTPSASALTAWASSPYRTVGVYVGGTNMACGQANLTASWVRTEAAAGWHFIPTYVGLQAPGNSCGCAAIQPGQAAAEGAAAATDAVTRMQALGLGRGNPVYFDMEAYPTGGSATSAVETFLSAWTSTLHASGYLSGVYSSANSGISDLVAAQGTGFVEPDELWIARWDYRQSTADAVVPSYEWALHQRIHQFSGGQNVTYGGVTINIDGDYLDGATAPPAGGVSVPDGTFVQVTGLPAVYRIAGGAPLYVSDLSPFGNPPVIMPISSSQFAALSQVPADRTFLTTTTGQLFRVAGGAPLAFSSWAVFGGVQQPSVTVDQWDIDNISNPLARLRAQPANGTLVEGLPSQTYWRFATGGRVPVAPTRLATPVDDAALGPYPLLPPDCVAPRLHHLTIGQVRRAVRIASCRLGKVHRPRHWPRHHVLRVSAQTPVAGSRHRNGYLVGVTLR